MKAFLIATTALATASAAFALDDRTLLVGQTITPAPSLTEFQADAATDVQADAAMEADALSERQAEAQAEAATHLEADAATEAAAMSERQAEAATDLQHEAEMEADALSERQAEAQAEAATNLEADAVTEADALSASQAEAATAPELQTEAHTNAEATTQAEASYEDDTVAESTVWTENEMDAQVNAGMQTGTSDEFYAIRWDEVDLDRASYTDSHEWIQAGVRSSDGVDLGQVERVRLNKNGEVDAIVVAHDGYLDTGGQDTLIERTYFSTEADADGSALVLDVTADAFEPASAAFMVSGNPADCEVNHPGEAGDPDSGHTPSDMK